ncbi:MAG: alanine racemase [Anaerolineae bacterium]|nr:alanine racemase [Anaerolineae bacterium]MDW8069555.1 alanine racemase [Anaerolineae bacterium]
MVYYPVGFGEEKAWYPAGLAACVTWDAGCEPVPGRTGGLRYVFDFSWNSVNLFCDPPPGLPPGTVTWAEIDLEAIKVNIRSFCRWVGPRVQVIAVVKANAYGHGAVPVARTALEAGASRLAVHRLLEGVELRQAGIPAPILVMGYVPPDGAEEVIRWGLTPTVTTPEVAQALSARAVAAGVVIPVHIKVDTGMGRFGLLPDEVVPFARALSALPGLRMEGIFTHFCTADSADPAYMRLQFRRFVDVLEGLSGAGISIPLRHACNSAATMRFPEAHLDAVRPGIAIYGLDPSSEWPPVFPLRPAMMLKSRVVRVRTIPPGWGIGYGRTFIPDRPMRVALLPVGYGDGYHRILSNRGAVLLHGQRAPVLGRVSMDQIVVDVSHIPEVREEDVAVLFGRQGEAELRVEEVAAWAETINYEVTTSILPRVARIYV